MPLQTTFQPVILQQDNKNFGNKTKQKRPLWAFFYVKEGVKRIKKGRFRPKMRYFYKKQKNFKKI